MTHTQMPHIGHILLHSQGKGCGTFGVLDFSQVGFRIQESIEINYTELSARTTLKIQHFKIIGPVKMYHTRR